MTGEPLGHPRLVHRLREEIRERGPLTFARFMELVLHHPRWGYYAAGPERLGERGDFTTASDLGPAFGRALARQVVEMDELCGRPEPFELVEFGAGRGLLARDICSAIDARGSDLATRIRHASIDTSRGMRRSIEREAPGSAVHAAAETLRGGQGCVLAVELLDALPVHRVVRRAGRLQEIGVDWDGERFVDAVLEPGERVLAWAERYGAAAEEGFEAEVNLALDDQFARFDRAIDRGFALVLDYGDTARRLYTEARARGTLLAYHAHRTNEDYLARVGRQDLTAHVNFTALCDAATDRGWQQLGCTTQDRFLIANGILEQFERMDDAAYRDPRAIQRRQQIKQLIQPTGMGRVFQVWMFSKGLDPVPVPAGLSDPFAR